MNNKELKLGKSDDIKVKLKKILRKIKNLRVLYKDGISTKLYCYATKYFKIQSLNFFN